MKRSSHFLAMGLAGTMALALFADRSSAQMMGPMGPHFWPGMRMPPPYMPPYWQPYNSPMQRGSYGSSGINQASLSTSRDYSTNQKSTDLNIKETPHRTGSLKAAPPDAGVLKIAVPELRALVWLDGVEVSSAGLTRYYVTPELEKGKEVTYAVKIQWEKDGAAHTQERQVPVTAGRISEVDFTRLVTTKEPPPPPQPRPSAYEKSK